MWRSVTTAVLAFLWSAGSVLADGFVNGYTYVAPSYYLTPPVLTVPPPVVLGPSPVMLARPVYAPVVVMEPAFLHTTVVPYDPVWNYPPAAVVAPAGVYRERVHASPREVEYKVKAPNGRTVYSYEVESRPYGGVVRERYR